MNRILRHSALTAICALLGASLNSCIVVAKSDEQTTGKKLVELKAALDKGAITKAEYETQKAGILEKN